jgi:HD-GYP domain-containing protein (c-di-GMP phosphodiesterase class II)
MRLTAVVSPELASDPELRYAYLLHDIGKIGIPDTILLKREELTTRERRTLQMHTTLGEHLISYIPFLSNLVHDVVAFHHEHFDGQGYPWGLSGEEIPLVARIFAVVDAFDAMTSNRPYRKALGIPAALEELERCAGTQFDPGIVAAFLQLGQRVGGWTRVQRGDHPSGRSVPV